jgi:acetyl esterase/lipase
MTYAYDPDLVAFAEAAPDLLIEGVEAGRVTLNALQTKTNGGADFAGVIIADYVAPGPEGAPGVPVRVYRPAAQLRPVPGLIQIHGGGFVMGSLDGEQSRCLALCQNLGIVVVSVDYRLAPETTYPGPLEDCYAALQWATDQANNLNMDKSRLGVLGFSAGGCLAAALALLTRDRGGPTLCFQYLGIPITDDRLNTPSMQQFVDTPIWNRPTAEICWQHYLQPSYNHGADDVPAYAAPARALDLSGLPPAYVSTMEFDPLRDEGIHYALRLLQAGVSVELHNYPGTFHGSGMAVDAAVSQREGKEMMAALTRWLHIN